MRSEFKRTATLYRLLFVCHWLGTCYETRVSILVVAESSWGTSMKHKRKQFEIFKTQSLTNKPLQGP